MRADQSRAYDGLGRLAFRYGRGAAAVMGLAGVLAACMPPPLPDEPRRVIDPGEAYWAYLDCTMQSQMAVAPPSMAPRTRSAPTLPTAGGEPPGATWMLEPIQEIFIEDCLRARGYQWYWEQTRPFLR